MFNRKLNIRGRLSFQFIWIVASILLLFSIAVYTATETYHSKEFFGRLRNKALTTARLLIEVNEVDYNTLKIFDRNTIQAMLQEKVVIYDSSDKEIYNSIDEEMLAVDHALLSAIRKQKEIEYTQDDRQVVGLLYADSMGEFVVIASAYDKWGKSKLENLRLVLASGFLIGLVAVGFAGWLFAGRALHPISNLIKDVDDISAQNMSRRVDIGNGTDELAQLAIRFNKMLDRLEAAFILQKSFISTASHELRTPLTAITGEVEVTLLKERNIEEYKKVLQSLLEEVQSLTKMTNGLLQLATAGMDTSRVVIEKVRVDDLLWECEHLIRKMHPAYKVSIVFDDSDWSDSEYLTLEGNSSLVKTAFLNVMENACKYSEDHAVEVYLNTDKEQISILFKDRGIGIAEEDMPYIFEPFYRAKNSHAISGHGIGLPLTKRIMELHNGTISVVSDSGAGTSVLLTLMVAEG